MYDCQLSLVKSAWHSQGKCYGRLKRKRNEYSRNCEKCIQCIVFNYSIWYNVCTL